MNRIPGIVVVAREITAGTGSATLFFLLTFRIHMPWWAGFILSIIAYAAIRMLFPPEIRKVQVTLPEGLSQNDYGLFIRNCHENIRGMKKRSSELKGPFQKDVQQLLNVCQGLVNNFEKDPEDIKNALVFPDRLERINVMLDNYMDIVHQPVQSPQTARALETTQKAIQKAILRFQELQVRLLENDALDLSTRAKTFDNLMDFD
ncbi:hypothetical protein MTBBW1_790057 [Desulfamplus magnetovallimortis]|uniref:5-bromo-4-chloroindolyl phosphate hydrolysis protein n=1 Tax=Desulfamplus magnetovallimortis TaxID=1246637 RepID=A0A1W1HJK9_9BACT|nr:5-bromo-4-chloroindolyl phosphate hydrolysis family protein [Desulfamplus magnetovallimortis]SLM32659.1 hypothetical protein MTBBW1_790057 [Desulfamplus magnetovallimortis]